MEPCPRRRKTRFWEDFLCPFCGGSGRLQSEREFSISIPPQVKHGIQAKLSLEDIGLKDTFLNLMIHIDPSLEDAF